MNSYRLPSIIVLVTALVLLAIALSSCAPTVTTSCPKLKDYTKTEQAQAATELWRLCPAAKKPKDLRLECPALILPTFIDDYGLLRKQLRSCQ